jgi:hypothetical protein
MNFKAKLFISFFLLIILVSGITLLENKKTSLFDQTKSSYKPGVDAQVDTAVNQANELYKQKKALGIDFSTGPCLTNDLMANWVVDIVHSPRIAMDDQPQNQCPAYIEGRAKHFIELDPNGNLVRVH